MRHKLSIINHVDDTLKMIGCETCSLRFMVEIAENGRFVSGSKININPGDVDAAHTLFLTPDVDLVMDVRVGVEQP